MSQAQRIADHLKAGHTLTPLEALDLFGCNRLAARIHDINTAPSKYGLDRAIESKMVEVVVRDLDGRGEVVRARTAVVARYSYQPKKRPTLDELKMKAHGHTSYGRLAR